MGVLGLSLEDKLAQDNRGGRRVNHSCRVFSSFQIVAEMIGRQWNADYPKLIGRCDKNETKETVIGVQQWAGNKRQRVCPVWWHEKNEEEKNVQESKGPAEMKQKEGS